MPAICAEMPGIAVAFTSIDLRHAVSFWANFSARYGKDLKKVLMKFSKSSQLKIILAPGGMRKGDSCGPVPRVDLVCPHNSARFFVGGVSAAWHNYFRLGQSL
jgi:hypothetical protein